MGVVKVRIYRLAGWEELVMNETGAATPNTFARISPGNDRVLVFE